MSLTNKTSVLKILAVLSYLALLTLLLTLLLREVHFEKPPFSLVSTAVMTDQRSPGFSLRGENLNSGIRGLAVRELVDDKQKVWSQLVDAPVRGATISGNLMLASIDKGTIVSFSFNRGEPPRILGSLQMPSTASQIVVVNKRAVFGLHRHDGLALVDLADPTEMRILSYLPEAGMPSEMTVVGNQVYYADIYAGIKKIDLSSDHPVVEKMVELDSPWKVAHRGQQLAVGTIKGEVFLYEITSSGQLKEVGQMGYPSSIMGLAFSGKTLAVATKDKTVEVYKLSSWPKLADPVHVKLPGKPLGLEAVPGEDSVVTNLVPNALAVIDLTDPSAPGISGYKRVSKIYQGIVASANTVVGMSNKGLDAFSLEEIKGREAVTTVVDDSSYHLLSWNGQVVGFNGEKVVAFTDRMPAGHNADSLLVVAHDNEVDFYVQREDGAFLQVGAPLSVNAVVSAAFHGGYLYVLHRKGLQVLKGDRPEGLEVIADLSLPGIPQAFQFLTTGQVLVASRGEGLQVVDVKDPRHPNLVTSLPPLRHVYSNNIATDLLVEGQKVYIAYGLEGVQVVDISVPEEPKPLQVISTHGFAKRLLINDGVLLVADVSGGIFLIDTRAEQGAVGIGSIGTPFRIDEMAQAQGQLVVSSSLGGTMKTAIPQRLRNVEDVSGEELYVGFNAESADYDVFLYDERTSAEVSVSVK